MSATHQSPPSRLKALIVPALIWLSGHGANSFAECIAARLRRFNWFRAG